MNRPYGIKTVRLTAISGMLLAGLLAMAISEIDQYYDWLLIAQSISLGLAFGLLAGAGLVYYQPKPSIVKRKISELVNRYRDHKLTVTPKPAKQPTVTIVQSPAGWLTVLGVVGRGTLGGLVGLLLGSVGGIWYCVELYSDLSSDAQSWILIYLPFYAITALFCAVLGSLVGAMLGLVWRFLWPIRS